MSTHHEQLRLLHRPGDPLLLPNAWDVATARAVVEAGFPVVATTSGGIAATLGYDDHEGAPGEEMLRAAARIVAGVEVPCTVDAEAGYGMDPVELAEALHEIGAAGCNLEDSDHARGQLRDPDVQADWLRAVREAAPELVINARIDVFLAALLSGSDKTQADLLPQALARAEAYLDAGADCVFPIALFEHDSLKTFIEEAAGPVNVLAIPNAPAPEDLASLGAARISWGTLLHTAALQQFKESLPAAQRPLSTPS
ncbi:MAG TPA: isocitrate lyase/phosphoenolpyruvate mutase family protein [Thermoleophilaceae bacterium]|jgi:2-methylisocitrate lyase-like PEP mutase family enzyme